MGKCLSKKSEYKLKNEPDDAPYEKTETKEVAAAEGQREASAEPENAAAAEDGGDTQQLLTKPGDDGAAKPSEPKVEVVIEPAVVTAVVTLQAATPTSDEIAANEYFDFPFLDEETKKRIQDFKILFIMRGLSGSGKSYIAEKIAGEYKNVDVELCSADHFFVKEDGTYMFDGDKLKEAHQECQAKAGTACSEGKIVIIDNTNVRRWELQHYVKLAADYSYTVLIVEPQTPWCFEPSELVQKSTHGVSLGLLEDKVKKYDKILPQFVGWFLNKEGTDLLGSLGEKYFKLCLEAYPELAKCLKKSPEESDQQENEDSTTKDFGDYFTRAKGEQTSFHCTAFYAGTGKSQTAKQYFKKKVVQKSMGKYFPLKIIGIVVTPRTLGARVELNGEQLELWQKDDKEATGDKKAGGKKEKKKEKKEKKKQVKDESDESVGLLNAVEDNTEEDADAGKVVITVEDMVITVEDVDGGEDGQGHTWADESPTEPEVGSTEHTESTPEHTESTPEHTESSDKKDTELRSEITESIPTSEEEVASIDTLGSVDGATGGAGDCPVEESWENHPTGRFHPTSGKGSRSHVTLGCHGVEPVQTGLDLVDVIKCEIKNEGNDDHKSVDGGAVRYYGEGRCVVYLDTPVEVATVFSGCYA